jgi:hypothetical protein
VGLERGPLNLVSTTEELLERKSSGSDAEKRDYGRRGSAALTTQHPSIRKLVLTSPTSGSRSVGVEVSRALLRLRHGYNSVIQRKENVPRWKPLPNGY